MEPKRVLILEDEPLTCLALKMAFDEIAQNDNGLGFNVEICHTYIDALNTIEAGTKVNLAILDFRLGSESEFTGLDFARHLKVAVRNAKIIFLTSIGDKYLHYTIFREINPEGFIIKSELGFPEIVESICKVMAGDTYYSRSVQDFLRKEMAVPKEIEDIDRRLLFLLSRGAGTRELSEELKMSTSGIEWRKRRLARLFGLDGGQTHPLIETARNKGLL